MKTITAGILFSLVASVSNASIVCRSTEKSQDDGIYSSYMEQTTFEVTELTPKSITLSFKGGKFEGSFSKIAKNGALVYASSEVTDVGDQTDYGFILVANTLSKTGSGTITLSTRQLGDSEGSSWLNETFACASKK